LLSAAHVAVREHVPVLVVIVTVLPEIEHAPLAVMVAVVLELVLADTTNIVLAGALAGAPVKVTVGEIFVAVVD
jgi:hypothetical protein